MSRFKNVIVYHVGARDKYSIAKYFAQKGDLQVFITDYWMSIFKHFFCFSIFKNKIGRRYDKELSKVKVIAYPLWHICKSYRSKHNLNSSNFKRWIIHDKEFTDFVLKQVLKGNKPSLIWGYSNANLEVLEFFKDKLDVLKIHNQIDPGIEYYNIQYRLWLENKTYENEPERLPKFFENRIRKEWDLADIIVVNSKYSKKCIIKHGADDKKIEILPLIYESKREFVKKEFNSKLNIAFVGNINLIKGFKTFIEVAEELKDNFNFIAIGNILIKTEIIEDTKDFINYTGQISKFELEERYKNIDVLVFPTYCDGFGMVQLEAMSFGIPVLATANCGEVVRHNFNGFLINNSSDIIKYLLTLSQNRHLLQTFSENAVQTIENYSFDMFERKIEDILGKINI